MPEVRAHPCGGDAEAHRGSAILLRVEDDVEPFRIAEAIAPGERARNLLGALTVQAGTDVDRLVVVRDIHLGALGRLCAFAWLALHQVGHWGDRGPDRVVEAAVDPGGTAHPLRARHLRRRLRPQYGRAHGGKNGDDRDEDQLDP